MVYKSSGFVVEKKHSEINLRKASYKKNLKQDINATMYKLPNENQQQQQEFQNHEAVRTIDACIFLSLFSIFFVLT